MPTLELALSFAIGDQVVVKTVGEIDKVAVDTSGEIVGYSQYHHSRVNDWKLPPGVYNIIDRVNFRAADGKIHNLANYQLELLARGPNPLPQRSAFSSPCCPLQFAGPLPELPFWEGDRVLYDDDGVQKEMVVVSIDHGHLASDDDTPPDHRHSYHVAPAFNAEYYLYASECNLKLIARGSVWQLYYGEKPTFCSPGEEEYFNSRVIKPVN